MLAKPMKYASLARQTLSLVSCNWSSSSSCKSCMECPGLQKCSATPDVSELLFIMSRRCSLSLSLICRPVCPMYWQSVNNLLMSNLSIEIFCLELVRRIS